MQRSRLRKASAVKPRWIGTRFWRCRCHDRQIQHYDVRRCPTCRAARPRLSREQAAALIRDRRLAKELAVHRRIVLVDRLLLVHRAVKALTTTRTKKRRC